MHQPTNTTQQKRWIRNTHCGRSHPTRCMCHRLTRRQLSYPSLRMTGCNKEQIDGGIALIVGRFEHNGQSFFLKELAETGGSESPVIFVPFVLMLLLAERHHDDHQISREAAETCECLAYREDVLQRRMIEHDIECAVQFHGHFCRQIQQEFVFSSPISPKCSGGIVGGDVAASTWEIGLIRRSFFIDIIPGRNIHDVSFAERSNRSKLAIGPQTRQSKSTIHEKREKCRTSVPQQELRYHRTFDGVSLRFSPPPSRPRVPAR